MSHHIDGYIGPFANLKEIAKDFEEPVVPLPKKLGFWPLTDVLHRQLENKKISKKGIIAKISTDYFGGFGEQSATVWQDGRIVYSSAKGNPINEALKLLGVVADEGKDEFDTVGLGKHRDNDEWSIRIEECF